MEEKRFKTKYCQKSSVRQNLDSYTIRIMGTWRLTSMTGTDDFSICVTFQNKNF